MEARRPDVVDGLADVVQQPLGELHVGDHARWIDPEDDAVALFGQVVVTREAGQFCVSVLGLQVRHVEGILLFIVEADVEGGALELLQFDLVVHPPLYVLQIRQIHVEQAVAAEKLDLLCAAADDGAQQGAVLEGIGQGVEELDAGRQFVAGDEDHHRAEAADAFLDAVELADADVVVGQQVGGIRLDLQLRGEVAGEDREHQRHQDDAHVVVVNVMGDALIADAHGGQSDRAGGQPASSRLASCLRRRSSSCS